MRTIFPGSYSKINGIFGISMFKSTGKDAESKTFQTFVGIDAPYSAGQVRSFSAFLRSCVRTHRLFRNARTQERKVFQRNASKRNAPPEILKRSSFCEVTYRKTGEQIERRGKKQSKAPQDSS